MSQEVYVLGLSVLGLSVQGVSVRGVYVLGVSVRGVHVLGGGGVMSYNHLSHIKLKCLPSVITGIGIFITSNVVQIFLLSGTQSNEKCASSTVVYDIITSHYYCSMIDMLVLYY